MVLSVHLLGAARRAPSSSRGLMQLQVNAAVAVALLDAEYAVELRVELQARLSFPRRVPLRILLLGRRKHESSGACEAFQQQLRGREKRWLGILGIQQQLFRLLWRLLML